MQPTILVVDDDAAIRQGVATLLEQAGYATTCAANGTEALRLLTIGSLPALVILDVMLPEQDGYSVCRAIRGMQTYLPILMLSARDELFDKVTGLEIGADEYLTKPFHPAELIARVRAMLRFAAQRTNDQPTTTLQHGPITMLLEQHTVYISGQTLELPPKEWALLEMLLRHPGQVFGREMLLRDVWGHDFLGDSRTVDVHIQRLRARLNTCTPTEWIQTVRGFGYRLRPIIQEPVV